MEAVLRIETGLSNYNYLDQFLSGQISPRTKRAYQTDLRMFLEFAGLSNIKELTSMDKGTIYNIVTDYRNSISIINSEGYLGNASTVARKISSLKTFFQYLVKMDFYSSNPLDGIKNVSVPTESTSNGLTIGEVRAIFEQVKVRTIVGKRDRAILSLLFHCAMRRSEVANLKIGNIIADGEYTVIRFIGKRNKKRSIPLKPEVLGVIKEYITGTGRAMDDKDSYLFISHSNRDKSKYGTNKPIDSQSIYYMVKKYTGKAKIDRKISPHSFRHTAVTVSLDNGSSYRDVMNLTGHSDSRLVMRYDRGDKLKNNATWKIPSVFQ